MVAGDVTGSPLSSPLTGDRSPATADRVSARIRTRGGRQIAEIRVREMWVRGGAEDRRVDEALLADLFGVGRRIELGAAALSAATAALMPLNTPVRLIAITASHCSGVNSPIGP